ncbi:hypothetical protein EPUS_03437 [Endocarpon pusillum Z07020]|uniref:Uncharacterized protein n=1 Tax=Endocarpon pusillum (strain Z07020 / HMAS-L-300199) TaxID=1263415 RepID=U1G9T1_ENDPU|nr:uncharacterized protein EPUS_03437 [Endocarpon pusillum Z07020]ERF74247.1 hypothetical protein EPUS_03437 [Endocarpon pusillum Z07020]
MSPIQCHRPADRNAFEIAILCALSIESDAVEALFDDFWEEDEVQYGKAPGDPNSYTLGRIGLHNVVLAYMPAMGKAASAGVAAYFRTSFPNVRLGLVVGVCGGVPYPPGFGEIFLGDVIISTGVIQFDLGRQYSNRVVRKDTLQDSLGRPNHEIRAFLNKLQGWRARSELRRHVIEYVAELCSKEGFDAPACPQTGEDKLYHANYRHKHQDAGICDICAQCVKPEDPVCDVALESTCAKLGCDDLHLVPRKRASRRDPSIRFGLMASGDVVMKSGLNRDHLAAEEKVIGFEMEGAGVWETFPTVVIKGVCDYSDSHKSKKWQNYVALIAAACAKGFLRQWRGIDNPKVVLPLASSVGSTPTDSSPPTKTRNIVSDRALKNGSMFETEEEPGPEETSHKTRSPATPQAFHPSISRKVERMILQEISFRGMFDREQSIKENYPQTFKWIFDDSLSKDKGWHGFTSWLCSGSGCYWCSGKPASGKSTLMKYLMQQNETKISLQKWAGRDKLHFAGFFFWHLGTGLQKSQTGLLRSLLYSVLDARREFIGLIFSEYFNELAEYETFVIKKQQAREARTRFNEPEPHFPSKLSDQEYRIAFRKLVDNMPEDYKICFFIDGIDEYDGDHYEISELLRSACGPRVKMLVSSRPVPACAQVFKGSPSLKLQDLTRPDIKLYIDGQLRKHSRMQYLLEAESARANKLITEILDRAAGVFLWVFLVVNNLMHGLNNFDTINDLEKRLDYFPTELDNLYQHMMEQMEPLYRRKASEYLQIVLHSLDTGTELTLLKMSFAEDEDPTAVLSQGWEPPNSQHLQLRKEATGARITSRCCGLLELSRDDISHPILGPGPYVNFLHKSVADYLRQPGVWSYITGLTSTSPFAASIALLSSTLQLAKIYECNIISNEICRSETIRVIVRQAEHAESAGIDVMPYLEELTRYLSSFDRDHDISTCLPSPLPNRSWDSSSGEWSVLLIPVWYGFVSCVTKILAQRPFAWVDAEYPDYLGAVSSRQRLYWCARFGRLHAMCKTIEALLHYGANPNTQISDTTAWGMLLVEIVECKSFTTANKQEDWTLLEVYFQLIVLFLKAGADPHLIIDSPVCKKDKDQASKTTITIIKEWSVPAWIQDVETSFLSNPTIPQWTKDKVTASAAEANSILKDLSILPWRKISTPISTSFSKVMSSESQLMTSRKRTQSIFSRLTRNLTPKDRHKPSSEITLEPKSLKNAAEDSGDWLGSPPLSNARRVTLPWAQEHRAWQLGLM